ncbi:hypothetical protein BDQ17DRAFT_1257587 [Cyathus striatus]|nr:hypothetical protein BDQ17DRAFT_1257587 [Cyathus striatus]
MTSNVWTLKPSKHHREGQCFAHFAIAFSTRDQANKAICNGIVVTGKHIFVCCQLAESKWCLCCQYIGGHLSSACKASKPVCAHCAEHHNTTSCPHACTQDHDHLCCANCVETDAKGHGAASHSCPVFLQKLQAMFAYFIANKYRFFPTVDPSA